MKHQLYLHTKSIFSCIIFSLFALQSFSQYNLPKDEEVESMRIDTNDYAATYLSITTTPYTLPKGALTYQNLLVGYNGLEYGVTDRFSVSAGFSFFDFDDQGGLPYFLFGKYNVYQDESTAISLSNLNIFYPTFSGREVVSVFYSNAAFGSKNSFFSFGAGYGIAFEDQNSSVGIFTFGYHNRFSKRIGLLIDVWLALVDIESNGVGIPLPSIAFRFYFDGGAVLDFGLPIIGFKVPILKPEPIIKQRSRRSNM